MNYKQYFGDYHFYLPPKIGKDTPTFWSINSKKGDSPFDNYYMLVGWVKDSTLKSRTKDDKIYYYHTENFVPVSLNPYLFKKMYFMMKNKKDGDTLYWSPQFYKGEFILVPYFIKQKYLYENKTFYFEGEDNNVRDLINKNHVFDIKPNSKWICKEVTLLKESQHSLFSVEDKYVISYVFINDKKETFARISNPFYPEVRDSRTFYGGKNFISEKEFLEKENAIKKAEQMRKDKWDDLVAKEKEGINNRKAKIIADYGQANADMILRGKVKLGFTREMCVDAWGPLFKSSKTINDQGAFETWIYSITQVLYFKNGILIQIEQ